MMALYLLSEVWSQDAFDHWFFILAFGLYMYMVMVELDCD